MGEWMVVLEDSGILDTVKAISSHKTRVSVSGFVLAFQNGHVMTSTAHQRQEASLASENKSVG